MGNQLKSMNTQHTLVIIRMVFYSILASLLILFSSISGYYGDEKTCIELRKYSRYWGIYLLIVTAIYLVTLIYTCVSNNYCLTQKYYEEIQLIEFVLTMLGLCIVCVITDSQNQYEADKKENCGSLYNLILSICVLVICWNIILIIQFCIVFKQLFFNGE